MISGKVVSGDVQSVGCEGESTGQAKARPADRDDNVLLQIFNFILFPFVLSTTSSRLSENTAPRSL
jgi:hypothetical protein